MNMDQKSDATNILGLIAGTKFSYIVAVLASAFVLGSASSFVVNMMLSSGIQEGPKVPAKASALDRLRTNNKVEAPILQPIPVTLPKKILDKSAMTAIMNRNLFNSEGTLGDTDLKVVTDPKGKVEPGKILKSKLPLKVLGIIFGGDPSVGLALIEDQSKKTIKSRLIGDKVYRDATLAQVYEKRIVIANGENLEYIELEEKEIVRSSRKRKKSADTSSQKIAPLATGPVSDSFKEEGFERSGNAIQLTTQYRDNLLGPQISKVLQDAKAEPNMVGGELQGFKLTRIREGSIYQKAGFQSNDIILEINGIPLRDAAGAIRHLNTLRNETEIEVRVQRDGSNFNTTISVQ